MLGVIGDRQAVQVLEDGCAQLAQHVLPGPGHREEGRAGEQTTADKQDHH